MANPVLDAYIKGVDESRQNALAGAQQQALFTTIAGAARKQQLDDAFRQEIGQAASPAEAGAIAAKYAGPQGVLSHADTQARIKANNEATLSRIQQAADQFQQRMELAYRNASTAEQKAAVDAQYKQGMLQFHQTAQRMTGERLFDETGIRVPVPNAPQIAQQPVNPALAGRPQNEIDAINLIQSGQATSARATPGQPAQIVSGPTPAPAPQPAPVAPPQVPAPVTPYNMADPELRRVAGAQPATAPTSPVPTAAVLKPEQAQAPKPTLNALPPSVQAMVNAARSPKEARSIEAQYRLMEMKKSLKTDINLAGGRESMMIGRVMNAAEQAARAMENISAIPIETQSRGLFGGRGQEVGILNAGKETLANAMTTQDVQSYNVLATGLTRTLGAIETSGLGVTNNLMHQMEGVIFKEGDTNLTKLKKLAEIRQIIDAGMETVMSNPRNAPEIKEQAKRILARVEGSIPFTQLDLINLEKKQKINPNSTLQDVLETKQSGAWKVIR